MYHSTENPPKTDGIQIRTLIVEPDWEQRGLIRGSLQSDATFSVLEESSNGLEALSVIRESKPDLLISEVEIPGMQAISLLEALPLEARPVSILISRQEHFAARAFEVSALDYILKPYRPERMIRALGRAKSLIERRKRSFQPELSERNSQRLAIKTGRCVMFLKMEELDWAEAEGKYVRLHLGKEAMLLKISITALEAELNPQQFIRIHRSTIINVDRVRWVQPWVNGRNYQVVLHDGTRLVLSRKDRLNEITGRAVYTLQPA